MAKKRKSSENEWRAEAIRLVGARALRVTLADGRSVTARLSDMKIPTEPRITGVRLIDSGHAFVLHRSDGSEDDVALDLVRYVVDDAYRRKHEGSAPRTLAEVVGWRIRTRRVQLGLTQTEIAKRLGMALPNYNRLEAGKHVPSLALVVKVAAQLEVTIDDLVRPLHRENEPVQPA
jgi:DNA-binding XRE family transcriptional regulator